MGALGFWSAAPPSAFVRWERFTGSRVTRPFEGLVNLLSLRWSFVFSARR